MLVKETERDGLQHYIGLYGGQGSIAYHDFFRSESNLPIRFQIWSLPPGAVEGEHEHEGEENLEEIYYVIAGEAEFRTESATVALREGDAVMVSPDERHGIKNIGQTVLKLAVIYGKATGPHVPV